MDCDSTNILEIWKELALLTVNGIKEVNNGLEEQTLKLDVVYNNLLQSVQKDTFDYVPEKKISKRQSKAKNEQVGDLFSTEPNFQQPAVPPIGRSKRLASIMAIDKMKGVRESTTISSGASTRASRARALSTFTDITQMDCPKANSTFVVDKKRIENKEEYLSPQMFSLENETYIKSTNANKTYNMPKKSVSQTLGKTINLLPEKSPIVSPIVSNCLKRKSSTKNDFKKYSDGQIKNKQREKLEDIDVNIEEQTQHMTRTMKRKLQSENQINNAKKTNVIHVPLEKQISTPLKPLEDLLQTPHQIRENEAEKRKELYLKSKADQKKFDEQHLKVAKQREEQMKRVEEKMKKAAEERRKKEEKQKEKDLLLKEEALKKQKQAELKLIEINAKRKQAEEAKMLKMQKADVDRKLKENDLKKKNELKPEKIKPVIRPKIITSNEPTSSVLSKVVTLPKSKTEIIENNKNDYGLNDVSARDSSEDESGPKKPVPTWAKREIRKPVLEKQYHVASKERDQFFNCPKSMNLKEMFKGLNIRDRQRTSSAVWNTPPRYSEYIRRH